MRSVKEIAALRGQLETADWIFAKTMPDNPHEYTLRKRWESACFDQAVQTIREHGQVEIYRNWPYTALHINEHKYWTMGAPVAKTILINRCRLKSDNGYSAIAGLYDAFYGTDRWIEQDERLSAILPRASGRILDIGSGTGHLLDLLTGDYEYCGVEESERMCAEARTKRPDKRFINCPLARFYDEPFDLVASIYGSASYLSYEEIHRAIDLTKPGGETFLMFYRPDYSCKLSETINAPIAHKRTLQELKAKGETGILGDLIEFDDFLIFRSIR